MASGKRRRWDPPEEKPIFEESQAPVDAASKIRTHKQEFVVICPEPPCQAEQEINMEYSDEKSFECWSCEKMFLIKRDDLIAGA